MKIPYQEALQQTGYQNSEPDFLDRLAQLGISGYSAQLEGIEQNILKAIPKLEAKKLISQPKEEEIKPAKEVTSTLEITIEATTKILQQQGIKTTSEEITDVVAILGYKEPFDREGLTQIAELVAWGQALQVQETTALVDRALANANQQQLQENAKQQGVVDAFLGEIAYSQSYLETRQTLSEQRGSILKKLTPSAAIQLSKATELGKEMLASSQQDWIESSQQQQSQQVEIQSGLSRFLSQRKSLLEN